MKVRTACLTLLAAVGLHAQQPTSLTLADAEHLAVQNHPRIASARLTAAAAHQTPLEFKAAQNPVVTGLVTGVGADSGSRLAAGGLNNPVVYSRLASGIAASQLLTDFGRTRSLVASADLNAQAQDQITETALANTLLSVVRAYFGVLRGNAILHVAEETVRARQLVADQVSALFRSQLKSQLDVSFANVNLADAQLLLSQARNDVKAAEASLTEAIGMPAIATFSLSEETMPDMLPPDVNPLIQEALNDRPEMKDLRLEQSAAERFVKAEHALEYPTIAAAGATGIVPAGEGAVPGRYGAAGINVTIPIFNGGLFHAREREAELKAQASAERVRDLSNRITLDVRSAWLGANTAFERVGLTSQLLAQSSQALDLAQGRYDLGLGSIVELSQAQLNLTSAQIADTSARYDYQAQRKVLDYQLGALR